MDGGMAVWIAMKGWMNGREIDGWMTGGVE